MTGYRTIIAMAAGLVVSVAASFGFVIPQDEQAAITGGIIAAVGLVLRFLTKGPVGGSGTGI